METTVIELVTFRLRDGVAEAAFLASVPPTDDFLRRCRGFVRRRLSKGDDGAWVDYAEWRDPDAAKAASDGFMADPGVRPFCEMIDMSTTVCRHLELKAGSG